MTFLATIWSNSIPIIIPQPTVSVDSATDCNTAVAADIGNCLGTIKYNILSLSFWNKYSDSERRRNKSGCWNLIMSLSWWPCEISIGFEKLSCSLSVSFCRLMHDQFTSNKSYCVCNCTVRTFWFIYSSSERLKFALSNLRLPFVDDLFP